MTDKQKIRAEIERLHEEYRGKKGDADVRKALRTVLFFIDTMTEEPNYGESVTIKEEPARQDVDAAMAEVEEKAKAFTAAHQGETADDILAAMRGEEPSGKDLDEEIARFFVDKLGFQRHGEVLEIDNLSIHVDDLLHIARHFANWQKQQMMKNAITCTVERHYDKRIGKYLTPDIVLNEPAYKEGDNVKLIIVKESI